MREMTKSFYILLLWTFPVRGEVSLPPTTETQPESTLRTNLDNASTGISDTGQVNFPIVLKELSEKGHGVRSGKVVLKDDKTILIPNFYYDGTAPDAHFLVGNGSKPTKSGIFIPDETRLLRSYDNEDVTIVLPEGLTVFNFKWLAVWCVKYELNLGSVYINLKQPESTLRTNLDNASTGISDTGQVNFPIVLKELSEKGHGVRSGKVVLKDDKTILIPNFYYDGTAPDAHFLVGNGSKPTKSGIFIPDETRLLRSYDNEDVTIVLPEGLTVFNFKWLAVWCVKYELNLGSVYINLKPSYFPPQTFGFESEVKSGPVVLINKKTLFVPSFSYSGNYEDVNFWVGNGTEPNSEGVLVPDEMGSDTSLRSYQDENIYIKLPEGITTDNIEYFAVWSRSKETNLGNVSLKNIANVPEITGFEKRAADGKTIMRIPKCCPLSMVLGSSGCEDNNVAQLSLSSINIYEHNNTHINNESLDQNTFILEPYIYSMKCQSGKYPLDKEVETFGLLVNGSLIVAGIGIQGIFSQRDYCVDIFEDDPEKVTNILVCAPEVIINHAMFRAYLALLIISCICFFGAFILYRFILNCKNIHKQCFSNYSFSMFITFLSLIVIHLAMDNIGCTFIGFIFQFAMISSFTWLAILCFDILFLIIYYNNVIVDSKTRMVWYGGIGAGVPILSLIISLCRNLVPDVPDSFFKPQYGKNTCYFDQESQRRIFFYVPIGLSIVVSLVLLICAKYKIVQIDRDPDNAYSYYWIENGRNYKFMLRRYFIICVTMLLWVIEGIILTVSSYSPYSILMAIEIIEAGQGIIILLLFVLNKEAKLQIMKAWKSRRMPISTTKVPEQELMMSERCLTELNGISDQNQNNN